jgi:photosynthetic reaction center cytochrome c subunit
MYDRRSAAPLLGERTVFLLVFGLISLVFLVGSIWAVAWINGRMRSFDPAPPASPIYTAYSHEPSDYIRTESLAAMSSYIAANPQPQNVQVLTGMTTAEISAYMVAQVSGGLGVDCAYCHSLANGNFAEEGNPFKDRARQMMLMAADLNQNFVAQLPATVGGKEITCATCHNGRPNSFNGVSSPGSNYPLEQSAIPDDFRLPLEDLALLRITGASQGDLQAVELNQNTMYHFNQSLGVGCAHCHNANYFPSDERAQKGYALTMLQMTQHIEQQYAPIMNNKSPSCWMCHRGAVLPPASANTGQVPAVLSSRP